MIITVYAIISNRNEDVRYIGQTKNDLKLRLKQHIKRSKYKKIPLYDWIKREIQEGYSIKIIPIVTDAVLHEDEIKTISQFKKEGAKLLNLTDGGQGHYGYTHSKEVRVRIGKRVSENFTEEHKQSLRLAAADPERREKISKSLKGVKKSAEHAAKVGATRKGKKLSEEHKKKLRDAWEIRKSSNCQ